jgi:hypothetical protein
VLGDQVGPVIVLDREQRMLIGGSASPRPGFPPGFAISRLFATDQGADLQFGSAGTVSAYDRLLGGETLELAVGADEKLTLLGDTGYAGRRLLRFEVDPGPRDLDGDRRGDRRDVCKRFYSRNRNGCPRVRRSAELVRRLEHRVVVRLDAGLPPCEQDERITIKRKRRGTDEVLDTARSEDQRYERPVPDGLYYAIVHPHLDRGFGFCARAKTRSVLVR